jgi:hypothetical protein
MNVARGVHAPRRDRAGARARRRTGALEPGTEAYAFTFG